MIPSIYKIGTNFALHVRMKQFLLIIAYLWVSQYSLAGNSPNIQDSCPIAVSKTKRAMERPFVPKKIVLKKRAIVMDGDPILTQKTHDLTSQQVAHPLTQNLIQQMIEKLKDIGGAGLAAPQVGSSLSVIVVTQLFKPHLVLVNPKFSPISQKSKWSKEKCLSVEKSALVPRYKEILVEYMDASGEKQMLVAKGRLAVVLQHKIDHLHGILNSHREADHLKKYGIKKDGKLNPLRKVELSNMLGALGAKGKDQFRFYQNKMNSDLTNIGNKKSLVYALAEGENFDQVDALISALFDYYKIRLSELSDAEKARKIKDWISSPAHRVFAYEDLIRGGSGSKAMLLELSKLVDFKKIANNLIMGPPFLTPYSFSIPSLNRYPDRSKVEVKNKKFEDTLQQGYLAAKYSLTHNNATYSLKTQYRNTSYEIRVTNRDTAFRLAELIDKNRSIDPSKINLTEQGMYFVENDANLPITFGIEGELSTKTKKLSSDYLPVNMSPAEWARVDQDDRAHKINQGKGLYKKTKVVLTRSRSAPEFLPNKLYSEAGDRVEMRGMVYESLNSAEELMGDVSQRYGKIFWQGHVAGPGTKMFYGLTGYSILEHDINMFESLSHGYQRHQRGEGGSPASGIMNLSLQMIHKSDQKKMQHQETIGKAGDFIEETRLMLNAPVMRSHIYPRGINGIELRQYHARYKELAQAMANLAALWSNRGNLEPFSDFNNVEVVEKNMWPFARGYGEDKSIDGIWKSYFNFGANSEKYLMPLRNWADNPAVYSLPHSQKINIMDKVHEATQKYVDNVSNTLARHTAGKIDGDEAEREIQIHISAWAFETPLGKLFKEYRDRQFSLFATEPTYLSDLKNLEIRMKYKDRSPLSSLPKLEFSGNYEQRTFSNGKSFVEYDGSPNAKDPAYYNFLKNSVEVIFKPVAPYGHIQLRVGLRFFSFNFVKKTTQKEFDLSPSYRAGHVGFVFHMPSRRIIEALPKIESLFYSGREFNIPPFDAFSAPLKIKKTLDGGFRVQRSALAYSNGKKLTGTIIDKSDQLYIRSDNGYEYPLDKFEGRMCIQSVSCTSAVTFVLSRLLGIDVEFNASAQSLKSVLTHGNQDHQAPNVIIRY